MWEPIAVTEKFQDMGGRWNVRVLVGNGSEEESFFFKFHSEPQEHEALDVAQRICDRRNDESEAQ